VARRDSVCHGGVTRSCCTGGTQDLVADGKGRYISGVLGSKEGDGSVEPPDCSAE
jgi:hypothetical protein